MKLRYVEKDWMHGEYHCLIVFYASGHRCGYVGVPKSHRMHGEHCDNIYTSVHGGLTYSQPAKHGHEKDGYWYIGFDCNHYGDGKDYGAARRYFADSENALKRLEEQEVISGKEYPAKTQEFVEDEIGVLLKQLEGGME